MGLVPAACNRVGETTGGAAHDERRDHRGVSMPRGARPDRQLGEAGSFLRQLGDSGVHLHAVTCLHAHAQQLLPDAVARARDQGLTPVMRSGNCSASPPQPQPADTAMNDDQLDQDHRHDADEREYGCATSAVRSNI
jgi:hypothetical protein